MRKKLEAELISIAHRILKIKNKEDVRELHHETQKLYEKLSVLLFVEENFDEVKPTIGIHEIEEKLERAFDFDEKIVVAELKEDDTVEIKTEIKEEPKVPIAEPIVKEAKKEELPINEEIVSETVEPIVEKTEEVIENKAEALTEEPKTDKITSETATETEDKHKFLFEDILSNVQPEPIFERVETAKKPVEIFKVIEEKLEETKQEKSKESKKEIDIFESVTEPIFEKAEKNKSETNLNDKLNKGINITLNDRIAFEKNLFDGSTEDLNRVISQLSTFVNFEDAKNFIEEMVKPDYNDWKGKDEFVERFMEFVESKFV